MKHVSTSFHQHVLQPQHSLLLKGGEGLCENRGLQHTLKMGYTVRSTNLLVNGAMQTQVF